MKDMHKSLLRLWLIIWVLTLPLVHSHPGADHAHGMSGHVHGGTYHSVLVNTPVHAHQEYDQEEHHHDGFFSPAAAFGPSHAASHPPYDFEEATYGFSVIKTSIVLEFGQSQYSQDLVVAASVELLHVPSESTTRFPHKKKSFSILQKPLSPRAPPVLSV